MNQARSNETSEVAGHQKAGLKSRSWGRILLLAGMSCITIAAFCMVIFPNPAFAQQLSIGFGDDLTLTERAVQLVALITVLSLAPSILIMVTSFTRIVVVLSLLRSALGLQTSPPNTVMVSLALFLTAFIMAPTFEEAYKTGIEPLVQARLKPLRHSISRLNHSIFSCASMYGKTTLRSSLTWPIRKPLKRRKT